MVRLCMISVGSSDGKEGQVEVGRRWAQITADWLGFLLLSVSICG
ncbi:MAG: hypothetical protein ACI92S_003932 [Planctomycetaceae bacterium]|jgi:hypothetical protein